jgi:lipoprotein-anchoring transpeptidase ErfK/SrfK
VNTQRLWLLLTVAFTISFPHTTQSLPSSINSPGEKLILVDPRTHTWGAYTEDGNLIRSGVASTGKNWCADINRPCRTKTGTYRIYYLGGKGCYSTRFPIPNGGAPMPYCMYFNGNQALHGSYEVGRAHLSHGCVRLRVSDAKWLRYEFVQQGTLVQVLPY